MNDERIAPPLSGEIMSGPGAARDKRAPDGDFVDADFVTVRPGSAPGQTTSAHVAEPAPGPASGLDILKSSSHDPARTRRAGPMFWLFGLCLVVGAFWVSGGHALVSRPQPEAPAAAAPRQSGQTLRIVDVASRIEKTGDGTYLMVDGQVVNEGQLPAALPGLDISVNGRDGATVRYFLGTNERRLAPGERFTFSSRLHAPRDGAESVTVDFRKEGGV